MLSNGVSFPFSSDKDYAYKRMSVVESCGAMPDLEDKEGEVSETASCWLYRC
jgi:hypothetical protein